MKIRQGERGSALMITVVVVIIFVGISGAMLAETLFRGSTQQAGITSEETQLICDAALDRARRALLQYRNANDEAWGDVLEFNVEIEENDFGGKRTVPFISVGETVTDKETGEEVESSTAVLGWKLTDTERIKTEYQAALAAMADKAGPLYAYSQTSTVNTTIPANSETGYAELFCTLVPFGRGAYHIVVADNDDGHGDGVDDDLDGDRWNPDTETELASPGSDPLVDGDRQVFLVITALLPNGTMRQNVVLVQFPPRYFIPAAAILTDGSIEMGGGFEIKGEKGSVMANENVGGNGTAGTVEQSVNAAGTASVTLKTAPEKGINSGVTPATIPTVDLEHYTSTDFEYHESVVILTEGGKATDYAGNPVAVPASFSYSLSKSGVATWGLSGNSTVPPAIYYVKGDFTMTGQGSSDTYEMSIIAEGNINLGGNSSFKPFEVKNQTTGLMESTGILGIAGQDIELSGTGNSGADFQYDGVLIANEQISAKGNFQLNGAMVGVNSTDSPNSLISNSTKLGQTDKEQDILVTGNPKITYNGTKTFVPPPGQSVSVEAVRRIK